MCRKYRGTSFIASPLAGNVPRRFLFGRTTVRTFRTAPHGESSEEALAEYWVPKVPGLVLLEQLGGPSERLRIAQRRLPSTGVKDQGGGQQTKPRRTGPRADDAGHWPERKQADCSAA